MKNRKSPSLTESKALILAEAKLDAVVGAAFLAVFLLQTTTLFA